MADYPVFNESPWGDKLRAYIDEKATVDLRRDHGLVADTLTISEAGSHEFDLTGPLAVTVTTTGDVTLRAHGTGALTVAGSTFAVDGTATILVVTWPRGAQSAYQAGAGGGVPTDSTPPSPAPALTATGGQARIDLSWTASTDAETPVAYRYRVWPIASGASGEWIATTATTATVTGLIAGTYTAEVYAYSDGGATDVDSESVNVTAPAGWNTIASDDFAGTGDLTGRVTSVGDKTWTAIDASLVLDGDEATWSTHGQVASNLLPLGGTYAAGVRASVDYRPGDVAFAGSQPGVGIGIAYTSTTYGNTQYAGIDLTLTEGATATLSEAMVGTDTLALTGTLTGHPLTGRLAVQVLGTDVAVLVNGVAVATGTIPGTASGSSVRLGAFNRSIALDDYRVEVYTP